MQRCPKVKNFFTTRWLRVAAWSCLIVAALCAGVNLLTLEYADATMDVWEILPMVLAVGGTICYFVSARRVHPGWTTVYLILMVLMVFLGFMDFVVESDGAPSDWTVYHANELTMALAEGNVTNAILLEAQAELADGTLNVVDFDTQIDALKTDGLEAQVEKDNVHLQTLDNPAQGLRFLSYDDLFDTKIDNVDFQKAQVADVVSELDELIKGTTTGEDAGINLYAEAQSLHNEVSYLVNQEDVLKGQIVDEFLTTLQKTVTEADFDGDNIDIVSDFEAVLAKLPDLPDVVSETTTFVAEKLQDVSHFDIASEFSVVKGSVTDPTGVDTLFSINGKITEIAEAVKELESLHGQTNFTDESVTTLKDNVKTLNDAFQAIDDTITEDLHGEYGLESIRADVESELRSEFSAKKLDYYETIDEKEKLTALQIEQEVNGIQADHKKDAEVNKNIGHALAGGLAGAGLLGGGIYGVYAGRRERGRRQAQPVQARPVLAQAHVVPHPAASNGNNGGLNQAHPLPMRNVSSQVSGGHGRNPFSGSPVQASDPHAGMQRLGNGHGSSNRPHPSPEMRRASPLQPAQMMDASNAMKSLQGGFSNADDEKENRDLGRSRWTGTDHDRKNRRY